MKENTNELEREYLIPALKRLEEALTESGIDHSVNLGDEAVPGIWIKNSDTREVFCTLFALPSEEEEGSFETVLRFSEPLSEEWEGESVPGSYLRWAFPVYDIGSPKEFMRLEGIFLDSRPFRVLPEPSMAVSVRKTGNTEKDGDTAVSDYGHGQFACAARLNTISQLFDEEEEFNTGVLYGTLPYLQLEYGDHVLTLCYEPDEEDGEAFLLHLRADIPFEGEAALAEKKCAEYNFERSFTRAYHESEAFPLFGEEEENAGKTGGFITFHACVPERDGMPDVDRLAMIIRLFVSEISGEAVTGQ